MPLDDRQRRLLEEALAQKRTAKREDRLLTYAMEVTLTSDFYGYFNPRVTVAVDATSLAEVTHLKFTPVPEAGFVAIETCTLAERGAEQFTRGDSGRTGTVNLRAALRGFNLIFPDDRKLKLPVEANSLMVEGQEQTVLMVQVKRPVRQRRQVRPRKQGTAAAAPKPAEEGPAGADQKQ